MNPAFLALSTVVKSTGDPDAPIEVWFSSDGGKDIARIRLGRDMAECLAQSLAEALPNPQEREGGEGRVTPRRGLIEQQDGSLQEDDR